MEATRWTVEQMTLGSIIDVLKRKNPETCVMFDFVHFQPKGVHSYRGYYEQLAIGYEVGSSAKVGDLLKQLEDANGKKFYGYKGGTYLMHRDTPVWVANHNESGGTAIVDVRDDDWCVRLVTACID
jgi:hypothetical protein